MLHLLLKFNAAVIKEYPLNKDEITFGRKPGNDIVIDHPTISGFHGRILKKDGEWTVEDLNSTNGTFVNGHRIKTNSLKDKDQIGIAGHILEFHTQSLPAASTPPPPIPPAPTSPAAVEKEKPAAPNLELEKQRDILRKSLGLPTADAPKEDASPPIVTPEEREKQLAILRKGLGLDINMPKSPPPITIITPIVEDPAAPPPAPAPSGQQATIRIVSGGVGGAADVIIKDMVTYIGTASHALIKIKGFLAPTIAAAISRRPNGYFLKAVKAGYPKVNGNAIEEQILLEDGALIEAGGTHMVFYQSDPFKSIEQEPAGAPEPPQVDSDGKS